MTSPSMAIHIPFERIAALCRAYGVEELALHGSVLKRDFGPESPIHGLVEFLGDDAGPWMRKIFDLEADLARLFGRPVQIATRGGIEQSANPLTKREILDSARVVYRHDWERIPEGVPEPTARVAARIRLDQKELARFCRRHHIRRLALFGSVLREDFGPESDVDVLVEFEAGHTPGWEFFGMQEELTALFARKVDLNTTGFLSRYFRDQVNDEALTLYDAESQALRHGSAPSHA